MYNDKVVPEFLSSCACLTELAYRLKVDLLKLNFWYEGQ